MINHISGVRGRFALALAAALLGGSLGVPESAPAAPAPLQPPSLGCIPSATQECYIIYYNEPSHITLVGYATLDCNRVYTLEDGVVTTYYAAHAVFCPG